MIVKTKIEKRIFKPIEILITIESERELMDLILASRRYSSISNLTEALRDSKNA